MADYVTPEMELEIREVFDLFINQPTYKGQPPTKAGSVLMPISELPVLLRTLSLSPPEAMLAEAVAKADPQQTGSIEVEDFIVLVGRIVRDLGTLEVGRQCLRTFDVSGKPGGELSHAELRYVMTTLPGETAEGKRIAMTDEEFDEMLADAVAGCAFSQLEPTGSFAGPKPPLNNPDDGVLHIDIFTEFMRKFNKECVRAARGVRAAHCAQPRRKAQSPRRGVRARARACARAHARTRTRTRLRIYAPCALANSLTARLNPLPAQQGMRRPVAAKRGRVHALFPFEPT